MAAGRTASLHRVTRETDIQLRLDLDGQGEAAVRTGIGFFDHLLELWTRHGHFDLQVEAKGDLHVDHHHTVEDLGIVLGQAVRQALGERRGIRRYGSFLLPMDESLARVALDLSGRSCLVYRLEPPQWYVLDFNVAVLREFFHAFAQNAGATVHVQVEYGQDPHHMAEAAFKAFARALSEAVSADPREEGRIPSTKGTL